MLYYVGFLFAVPLALAIFYYVMITNPLLACKFGGVSNSVAFATALFTYIYVVLTGIMIRQMMKSQEEQLRPYITADLEYANGILYLIIQNIGQRAARDVAFVFTPDLIARGDRNYSQTHFKDPFAFVPPGKTIKFFMAWGNELARGKYPLRYDVVITYSYSKNQRATETYRLDISPFMGMLYHKTDDLNNVVSVLQEISDSLKEIRRTGIYAKTTEDLERENQALEEFWQEPNKDKEPPKED